MKAHKNWSYSPYRPPFYEVGDIYINRIAPNKNSIHFEWQDTGDTEYEVFLRKRGAEKFILIGKTKKNEFTINNLDTVTDYEFYVTAGNKKSRTRIARCGTSFGTVVNYLHPDDLAYSFSGRYLCSPSLVRHPDGYLLASMDLFAGNYPQNLTLIYRSDDNGKTWHYISELFPCFWGKMFIYQNELYMLACSTEYGDLLIGKSADGGKTFSEPTVLMRGSGGKNGESGWHKNPQPVIESYGRVWNTVEYGSWARGFHAVSVMSAKIGSDLLSDDSWLFSEPVKYNPDWKGLPKGKSVGNIEGCLVEKDNKLYNIMRYEMTKMSPNFGYVIAYEADTKNPENPLKYKKCIRFPANHSKFEMKYDEKTKKYYSIASRIISEKYPYARNLLSLMASEDLENWYLVRDIMDMSSEDSEKIGFQYVDFIIENGKILFLCRTAMNGAANFHDSNYSVFDVIDI
ncbi:MAG: hypothetical protein Q4B31_01180 [Clostridia bacterium]|nr:hypothetical protein [Clostridia bacterium]